MSNQTNDDEQIDGNGGWWHCVGCGSLSGLTQVDGPCTHCGHTADTWLPDGVWK